MQSCARGVLAGKVYGRVQVVVQDGRVTDFHDVRQSVI
jgi:hypothetical protein